MKIGILTFVGTQSHGACWQAYALKKTIEHLGHEAEIINYHCAKIDAVKTDKYPSRASGIKKKVAACLKYPIYRSRFHKFEQFEKDMLHLGTEVTADQIEQGHDRIIVGSDQVWNLDITGGDTTYFLPMIKDRRKKLSYAASLGTDSFDEKDEADCLRWISDLAQINVREESLRTYLSSRIDREISSVIDPTQLLKQDEWDELAGTVPNIKGKYLYVHAPSESAENWKAIYALAELYHLKIVYQTNRIHPKKGCRCLYSVSPEEYLNNIKFAEFVVTGSFHTLSFSLLFHRQFLCTDSMIKGRNSRIADLLHLAGCDDRILSIEAIDSLADIQYTTVTEALQHHVASSMKQLEKMLR